MSKEIKSGALFSYLLESKAFRNETMLNKYSTKELGEILFAMMLTLHLASAAAPAKKYCINSLKFPKFDHIFLSSTDLANAISTLKNAREYLKQTNVDIPVNELKHYLRGIVLGNNSSAFSRAFFFKLQNRLKIRDGTLLTLRREIVDGEIPSFPQKMGKQLYQYLRLYNNCDILVVLQEMLDSQLMESQKQVISDEEINDYMEKLKREIITSEGSLEGMCYDACLLMARKFPSLKWCEGKIRTKNGWEPHSWMVGSNGTIYDPTESQFSEKPTYEIDGKKCFVSKIDGKRIRRLFQ